MQFIQPRLRACSVLATRTDTPCRLNAEAYTQSAPGPRDSGTPDAKQQGQQDKASSEKLSFIRAWLLVSLGLLNAKPRSTHSTGLAMDEVVSARRLHIKFKLVNRSQDVSAPGQLIAPKETQDKSLRLLDGTQWEKHASRIGARSSIARKAIPPAKPPAKRSVVDRRPLRLDGCEEHSPSIPTAPLGSEEQHMRRFLLFVLTRDSFMSYRISHTRSAFAQNISVASCRLHLTCLPSNQIVQDTCWRPEYHLGSITGNSSFNTRRYQPLRDAPCLAWMDTCLYAASSDAFFFCRQWPFFCPPPTRTLAITRSIRSL
ncbi:hypothetical protein ACQKWADRAFT_289599 [Trichoderma austrokoningii]